MKQVGGEQIHRIHHDSKIGVALELAIVGSQSESIDARVREDHGGISRVGTAKENRVGSTELAPQERRWRIRVTIVGDGRFQYQAAVRTEQKNGAGGWAGDGDHGSVVGGGVFNHDDGVARGENCVSRIGQDRGSNGFEPFKHKFVGRKNQQINGHHAAGEIDIGGKSREVHAVGSRPADGKMGNEIIFWVAAAGQREDTGLRAAFNHAWDGGGDRQHRFVIMDDDRAANVRTERISGVGLQRERHSFVAFHQRVVNRNDR